MPKVIALCKVNTQFLYHFHRSGIFNKLCYCCFTQAARYFYYGFNKNLIVTIVRKIMDEQAVYFKYFYTLVFQIAKSRKTAAKIV